MDDEMRYRISTIDEISRLMTAYRRAMRGADQLRVGLVAAGLGPDGLTVDAGISETGRAIVHVTVYPVVAAQLAALIAEDRDGSSPPESGRSTR